MQLYLLLRLAAILILTASAVPILPAETPLYFGWSVVNPHAADYDGDMREGGNGADEPKSPPAFPNEQ